MSSSSTCSVPDAFGKYASNNKSLPVSGEVIDIGGSSLAMLNKSELEEKLLWRHGVYRPFGVPQRFLPRILFANDEGLELWGNITNLPNYYQTDGEIELFLKHGEDIANVIHSGTVLIDLGCGDVRKVQPLLDALEAQEKSVIYFAIELSRESLIKAMNKFSERYRHIQCFGLWGTIADGFKFYSNLGWSRPLLLLSLGSLFGNDHMSRAIRSLRDLRDSVLRNPTTAVLLTMDATSDLQVVWDSYNDDRGVFDRFIRNGCRHSNDVLGHEWYHHDDWKLRGELTEEPISFKFVLQAARDVEVPAIGLSVAAGEEIECYEAFKYGPDTMRKQFREAGLQERHCWKAPTSDIYQYLLVANPEEDTSGNPML